MSVALEPSRHKQRVRKRVLLESVSAMQASSTSVREKPNILITGTPGTGKTTHAQLIAAETGLKHINVGEVVRQNELHSGFDEKFQAFTIDDDKVNDYLEEMMKSGGILVDHHTSDAFPERFFDLVIVLVTNNTVLYDRLVARGYNEAKLQENVECEIMRVPVEEARCAYKSEIVQILNSDETDDMEANVEKVVEWTKQYIAQHKASS